MQLITVFSSLLLMGGLVAAAPAAEADQCDEPRVICIDAVNACGIKYGGYENSLHDMCVLSEGKKVNNTEQVL